MPETVHPEGELKESHPVSATGMIRTFNSDEMKQDYAFIDFGSTPLAKFEGKPVLIMGEREFAASLPKTEPVQEAEVIREKPAVEPAPVTEPAPIPEPQVTEPPA